MHIGVQDDLGIDGSDYYSTCINDLPNDISGLTMNKRAENIKKLNTKMFGERLEKLLELILKTTTYKDDNANLFHTHQILTENWLDRLNSGWMDLASERVEMMKQANNIWAVRKKIESGEVQEDENGLLEMEIKNFINNNEKINAIKHYRKSMREVYGKEVSLKEAKEYVDAVHTIIRQGK